MSLGISFTYFHHILIQMLEKVSTKAGDTIRQYSPISLSLDSLDSLYIRCHVSCTSVVYHSLEFSWLFPPFPPQNNGSLTLSRVYQQCLTTLLRTITLKEREVHYKSVVSCTECKNRQTKSSAVQRSGNPHCIRYLMIESAGITGDSLPSWKQATHKIEMIVRMFWCKQQCSGIQCPLFIKLNI